MNYYLETPPREEPVNVIPEGQRKTLVQLTTNDCRWPIGDPATPEFFFCGGRKAPGCSYCMYHARVAFQPSRGASASPQWSWKK